MSNKLILVLVCLCLYLFQTLKNYLDLVSVKLQLSLISFLYYEACGAFTMKYVVKSTIIKQFPHDEYRHN